MGVTYRSFATALCLFGTALLAASCNSRSDVWEGDNDPDAFCGVDPTRCEGLIGARCGVGDDCDDGVCCLNNDCGGGMCTYLCGQDPDCPPSMACHDGFCFYRCNADVDCGPGQTCEHDTTVCQY